MTSEPLSLPVSIRFYLSSLANRNAVDLIIRKPELPSDLRWNELLAFHDATMTAQRIRLDYFAFLYKAWEATWGNAKKQLLPSADQPMVSELAEAADEPTVATAWDYGLINKIAISKNCVIWSGIECEDKKDIKLYFYVDIGDEDYSLSDNLTLGVDWQLVDAENYRVTAAGLCLIKAEKADLTRLVNASYEALDLVLKNLK